MEKIMSKSNDVSTLDHHPLADNELDAVSGGMFSLGDAIKAMGNAYAPITLSSAAPVLSGALGGASGAVSPSR